MHSRWQDWITLPSAGRQPQAGAAVALAGAAGVEARAAAADARRQARVRGERLQLIQPRRALRGVPPARVLGLGPPLQIALLSSD